MADYTALKAAIASVIKTNGNQEITGLLLQQTLHSMIDGVNTTKQDSIAFVTQTLNKFLRDDNTFQEIPVPTGSFANNVYLSSSDSDVAGYKLLSYTPDASEVIISTTIKDSDGTKTIATYLYPAGLATTLVPAGAWSFLFNSYVTSAVGITNIGIQCFLRATDGSETNLFTVWSDAISSLTMLGNKIPYSSQSYPCNLTDRMGIRVLLKSTSVPQLTLSYVLGNGYASYFDTPVAIRHKQLRDLNEDVNFQHITTTEKAKYETAYTDRMKWNGGSTGLVAATARTSLGLVIGTDVLAHRTFGSAANNNTGDFLAYNGTAVDSNKLGGQLPSYYQTNIAAGTTLQYYRGDKSWQTLNTSVVPESGYLYFNTSRVLATALTGYTVGSDAILAATDTILAAFGKTQGQINNRALLGGALTQAFSVLSLNIEGTTLYKGDADFLKQLATMFVYESSTDSIKALKNFWSVSGVSAFGIGSGGGGGGGVNVIDNLTSTSVVDALSSNMGRVLYGYVNAKQPQLNGTGFVKISGTTISYDGNSYALSAHNHDWSAITSGKPTTLSGYGISSTDTMFDGKYAAIGHDHTSINGIGIGAIEGGYTKVIIPSGFDFKLKSGDTAHYLYLGYAGGLNYDGQPILHSGNFSSYADSAGAAATVQGNLNTHAGLTTAAHGLGASAFHADSYFIQNQNASAQTANLWISGIIKVPQIGSQSTLSNTIMSDLGYYGTGGYWGFRSDTSNNFNLDVYGNGALINALKILQSTGAAIFASTISALGGNSTQWNTTYSWGNHALGGYASASNLTAHIDNASPHLSASEREYFNKLKTYLLIATDNTSMHSTINFYSDSGVSAFGIGTGGGSGGGVNVINNLTSTSLSDALSANMGRELNVTKQALLNGTGLVRMSGTTLSYDNTAYVSGTPWTAVGYWYSGNHPTTLSGYGITDAAAASHGHEHLSTNYTGGQQLNPQAHFNATIGLKVAMTGVPFVWSDTLWINGYAGGDVKSMCALHTARNGTARMWISTQENTATSYGTMYEFYHSGNIATIKTDLGLGSNAYNSTAYALLAGSTSQAFSASTLTTKGLKVSLGTGDNIINAGGIFHYLNELTISQGTAGFGINKSDNSARYFTINDAGAATFASTVSATGFTASGYTVYHTGNLTNTLTSGYLPYWNGSSLANSGAFWDGTFYKIIGAAGGSIVARLGQNWTQFISTTGSQITNIDMLRNAIMGQNIGTEQSFLRLQAEAPYGVIGVGTGAAVVLAGTSNGNDGSYRVYTSTSGSPIERFTIQGGGNADFGFGGGRSEKLAVNGSGYFNGNLSNLGHFSVKGVGNYIWFDTLGAEGSTYMGTVNNYDFRIANSRGNGCTLDLRSDGVAALTGAFYASSYIESASYIKAATSVKIGSSWEAIPNGGNGLDLKYAGVLKATLSSAGDILAVGGVTCFVV